MENLFEVDFLEIIKHVCELQLLEGSASIRFAEKKARGFKANSVE